ncbi:MAG TPA: hypothetical protein VM577_14520 [Anaerovoracaceae bacterium]|nr:hypothetical protein [Anaerovoracaceae bacterium]
MTDITIIDKINSSAASLSEQDLDEWIVPEILKHYQARIDFKASVAYGSQATVGSSVATLAFREMAKSELRTALFTFLFKAQHWKTGRDINPYLLTSLSRLADRVYYDNESAKKANIPICPLCKEEGRREFLVSEGKLWRCENCTDRHDRLVDEIKEIREHNILPAIKIAGLDAKCNLYKIFSLHSRKGYRCADCNKFIPESVNTVNGISCPYGDCIFLGTIADLELMSHPVALTQRQMVSLQTAVGETNQSGTRPSGTVLQEMFEADVIQADVHIDVQERNQIEYNTLLLVIDDQIDLIKRMNSPGTMFQKLLMYEAYKIMLQKYPEEMVSYLVHQKQNLEFPIQSRIFQEYAGLLENFLPFTIKKKDVTYDIVDLTDPNLSLFLGISKFDALVRSDHTVPNNTPETYMGGRKFKNYGPCFIGKLIDVVDKNTGKSIKDHIKEYSFVTITFDETIEFGTPVAVTHFRIPSHYEMDSMVFLQRIRRQIVDKVFFRLNKKKREVRNNK